MLRQKCSTALHASFFSLVRRSPAYMAVPRPDGDLSALQEHRLNLTNLLYCFGCLLWSGEVSDADANLISLRRKLQRRLQNSALPTATWARLEAAVLTRHAELALWQHSLADMESGHAAYTQVTSLLSSALQVCLNSRSVPAVLFRPLKSERVGFSGFDAGLLRSACALTINLLHHQSSHFLTPTLSFSVSCLPTAR